MQKRRTRFMLGALLLALGVSVLGWYWRTRSTRPEATTPPQENTYLGLPTSHWRDQLNQPSSSHDWPPLDFALRRHSHRDAIPVLQDLLADPDPRIREAAVCCLGLQTSLENPVLSLLIRAVNDTHSQVRVATMRALAQHGPTATDAAPVLLAAMREDDADIRFEAARAYYHITGRADAVLPALIRNLGASEGCQSESASMLGKIGPSAVAAVDALVQRLVDQSAPPEREGPFGLWPNDSDSRRRDLIHSAVLEALGDIGPGAKSALPTIRPYLRARSGLVRASACVAYWKITGEVGPAVEPLVELLETGGDSDKRWSATGLGRMASVAEVAIPALVHALDDAEEGVRRDAALALGSIGPKAREAVPKLIALLKTDKSFRADIAKALKAIDEKAATEAGQSAP